MRDVACTIRGAREVLVPVDLHQRLLAIQADRDVGERVLDRPGQVVASHRRERIRPVHGAVVAGQSVGSRVRTQSEMQPGLDTLRHPPSALASHRDARDATAGAGSARVRRGDDPPTARGTRGTTRTRRRWTAAGEEGGGGGCRGHGRSGRLG